jgi:hypothetical protein
VDISEQWHTYSCLSQGLRGELVCVGPFSIGNILAIGSEFRGFVSAMGRFNKAKAAPAPSVSRGGQEVPVKTLQELVATQPLPLGRCVVPWAYRVPVRLQQWQLGIYWQCVGVSEWMSRGGFAFLCASWFCAKSPG